MKWLEGFSLDLKLGGRMLVKYPGLTIVGGLAMAFAICVGAVIFAVLTMLVHPTLPLPDGERIVQIRNWDVAANGPEPRALHDFIAWRGALRSVTELGAWRDVTRNLIVARQRASRRGRGDDRVRISRRRWRAAPRPRPRGCRRAGRCAVRRRARVRGVANALRERSRCVGRTVQLGNDYATVVGVMREGFAFPVSHELWMPLRTGTPDEAPRSGPAITIFGVLAPGATLDDGAGRADDARPPCGHRAARHARTSAAAGDAVRGAVLLGPG